MFFFTAMRLSMLKESYCGRTYFFPSLKEHVFVVGRQEMTEDEMLEYLLTSFMIHSYVMHCIFA